eukprot:gb/GECH01011706.1/.p1 GENE.gb/GECH01011706.1/~~gb/GECH01011706.1/.p1  ORF type:complete len:838 (+),score=236.32 gb/GECH01011706.1/:1-2514(+)
MADIFALLQKKSDSTDVYKHLRRYIKKQYGEHEAKEYEQSLQDIQQLRDEVRNLQDRSEGSKATLLKYFVYLRYLAIHFPINEAAKLKLTFNWYDSFSKKKCSQSNVHYEQACILFNAAAVESQLASIQKMNTTEGPKAAIQRLQMAAAILTHIKEEISPKIVEQISSDICPESLDCLAQLMLTYAQQCVFVKAKKAGMKTSNLSKLACETSHMYKSVLQAMSASTLANQFDRNWQSFVRFQSLYFEALTEYYLSTELHDDDEIGQEIARLEKAKGLLKDSGSIAKYVPSSLQQEGSSLKSKISNALEVAHDENQKIYHMRVPQYSSLSKPDRKRLVKSISFPDLDEKFNISDPFSKLVPVKVIEYKSSFNQRLNEKSQEIFRESRQHREQIRNTLGQMGLPGSILAAEQDKGFPESVFQKMQRIASTGGVNRLHDLRGTLGGLASETITMLEDMEKSLNNEEQEDRECRQKFAARWNRHPSPQLTVNLKKQLKDYQNKAEMASKSDGVIKEKIESNSEGFNMLGLSKEELDSKLPKLQINSESELGRVHAELKDALNRMDQLQQEEEQIEDDVNQMRESNSIDDLLVSNQSNLEGAVEEAFEPFDEKFEKVNSIMQEEDNLLEEIQRLDASFNESKSADNSLEEREEFIQNIVSAVNKYDEILSNIKEGIQFYSNMQDLAQKLNEKIESFVLARKTEKSDIISDIQRQMAQMGVTPSQPQSSGQDERQQQQQQPPQQPNQQDQSQQSPQYYQQQGQQYPQQHPYQQYGYPPQYQYPPQQFQNPQYQYPPQQGGYPMQQQPYQPQYQPYPNQQPPPNQQQPQQGYPPYPGQQPPRYK